MPVYQYEAMDNTGTEVKDTIEAGSEADAQQKIKEQGFFVTKISEKGRGKKKETEKKKPTAGSRKRRGFSFIPTRSSLGSRRRSRKKGAGRWT